MFSCSEFEEQEAISDYTYYLNEGWTAFEMVNLNNLSDNNPYYYDLALEMFIISIQAIDAEYSEQSLLGPYYQSYNGLGWSYLYYAGEFLGPDYTELRDSLRNTSKIYFDLAINDLQNSEFDNISNQDWCDTYLGLAYTNYYIGLDNFNFDAISFNLSFDKGVLIYWISSKSTFCSFKICTDPLLFPQPGL